MNLTVESRRTTTSECQQRFDTGGLVIFAGDHMLQSHTLLFPAVSISDSRTVFAALERTLFYDWLELWFD